MTASRPTWIRLDLDWLDHPKIMRATRTAGDGAALLWLRAISYSARHLTDGWVPHPLPKQWGHTPRHVTALEDNQLWIPLEVTDDGGWLINDYTAYQPTRQEWEASVEQRRKASRARWDRPR